MFKKKSIFALSNMVFVALGLSMLGLVSCPNTTDSISDNFVNSDNNGGSGNPTTGDPNNSGNNTGGSENTGDHNGNENNGGGSGSGNENGGEGGSGNNGGTGESGGNGEGGGNGGTGENGGNGEGGGNGGTGENGGNEGGGGNNETVYTVTFAIPSYIPNDIKNKKPAPVKIKKDDEEPINLTDVQYTFADIVGYDFLGWYNESGEKCVCIYTPSLSSNITLTAKFQAWMGSLNLVCSGDTVEIIEVEYGKEIILPTIKIDATEEYIAGWQTEELFLAGSSEIEYEQGGKYIWKPNNLGEEASLYAVIKRYSSASSIQISVVSPQNPTDLRLSIDQESKCIVATLHGALVFEWWVDGIRVENSGSSLSPYLISDGVHTVMAAGVKNGIKLSATIVVNVVTE